MDRFDLSAAGGPRGKKRRAESYLPESLRALPQSPDAEKGVLGSILLDPSAVLDECIKRQVTPAYFQHPAHARIYSAMIEMQERRVPIDLISVTQFLEDAGTLENVGGAQAIADLFTFVPTPVNALHYLEIVREKYLLRQVVTTCTELAARAYDEQSDVPLLMNEVERRVLEIGKDRFAAAAKGIKQLAVSALDTIETLHKNKGMLTGLATGFVELDRMTNGLQRTDMIVIAARPSIGKTAFAMNIVEHAAVDEGKAVAVYSLEMSAEQLALRMVCSLARVNLKNIRSGLTKQVEADRLMKATARISKARLFIDDTPSLEILQFQANARRLHSENKLDLIVIDYLQLMRSPSRRGQENRQVEVAEISAGIKALAKELRIPIIVLAQLNRNPDTRAGASKGRPRLSDLRESGSIEQDADIVGLLWREAYYVETEKEKKEAGGRAELLVEKHRNGESGKIFLTFLGEITRFEDRAPEDREAKG